VIKFVHSNRFTQVYFKRCLCLEVPSTIGITDAPDFSQ
jgi:hypothetical protein